MKIPKNNLQTINSYFKKELKNSYSCEEVDSMLHIVLYHFFEITKTSAILDKDRLFSESDLLKIINTVKELKQIKPLAYVLGEWEFYGLRLKVDENTLIPRPETEELVQLILENNEIENKLQILDIGTGSGCIGLALKANILNSVVTVWDVSEKALQIAEENAKLNELEIESDQIDILKPPVLKEKWDVIVSNPPYITDSEKGLMENNVLEHEPHLALFVSNDNPLLFYKAITDFAILNLSDSGKLYFEINENYGKEVVQLLKQKNMQNITLTKDINDKDRMVSCSL